MVRRNDFQKKSGNQTGNFHGPRNLNKQGQEHKNNNDAKNLNGQKNGEQKNIMSNEQPNETKRPTIGQAENSNESRKQVFNEKDVKENKDQREHREHRETKEFKEGRDYQQRNNHSRSYSTSSRFAGKIKAEETVDDIIVDISRIEKEIDLEIKEISSMRLGL